MGNNKTRFYFACFLACNNFFCSGIFYISKKLNHSKWSVLNEQSCERWKSLHLKKILSQNLNPKMKMKSRNQRLKKLNLILTTNRRKKKLKKILLLPKSLRSQNLKPAEMKKIKIPKCLLTILNRTIPMIPKNRTKKLNRKGKKNVVQIWLNSGKPSKTIRKISPVGHIFCNLWIRLETLTMAEKLTMLFFTDTLIVMDIGKNMLIWKNVKV